MKIPLAELIRILRSNKVGQGSDLPLNSNKIKHSAAESSIFKGFKSVATNGGLWRFACSKAHYFNGLLQATKGAIPVVKKWSAYKDLPQIKSDLYKEVQKIEGVRYE